MVFLGVAFADQAPKLVTRAAVPYVGIASTETLQSMATLFPRLMPKLGAYIGSHHLKPAGAPFIKYDFVNMPSKLRVELGMPLAKPAQPSTGIVVGALPAGRYAEITHFGDYSELVKSNSTLQAWCASHHCKFKMKPGPQWEFASRFESYETDPSRQPDHSKWQTDVFYLLTK